MAGGMIKKLKPNSEFSRNVLTLMTGTTIAQAIPVAITPVLTRLYTPEEFGLLALFVSISLVFSTIASGRYELAIMLPEKDEDAINIAALGVLIATILSFVLFFVVVLFSTKLSQLLGNNEIRIWLYFVPCVVWMIGLYNILKYLNTRKKLYKDVAISNVYKSTSMVVVQLVLGFIKLGVNGLIIGQIIAHLSANYKLIRNTVRNFDFKCINGSVIKYQAKRYINFPKFSLLASLANNLSFNLINIFVPMIYSLSTLGFYSLAEKMLGIPSSFIGTSIAQVFFQEGALEKQRTGKVICTFDGALKKLIVISIPVFGVLFFVVEDVFGFVFGEDWKIAGTFTMILIPMFAVRFVVSSVSAIDTIMEKQKFFLLFNIILLINNIIILYVSRELPFTEMLTYLSISILFIYLIYGVVLRKMAKGEL